MSVTERLRPAGAGAPTLWLQRLMVTGFRNLRQVELQCEGRPVVLVGPNGAGKSNLLEAISLLTPGRGLRRARQADLDRRGPDNAADGWAVAARIETPFGLREVGTGRDPAGGERRALRLDGAPASNQQALGEILACVWLTPAMDRLFLEGPSARRRFLDRLVAAFDPAHVGRASAYERAYRERARLLREGRADSVWLGALESAMAERSVAIAVARRDLLQRLSGLLGEAPPLPTPALALAGEVEARLGQERALAVEEWLLDRLAAGRLRDAEIGGAAVGAHRTDLLVSDRDRDMPAELCSTGEQKALLLAVLLAFARLLTLERGAPPLLLLDDVAAHLDDARLGALFEALLQEGIQAWMSGADPAPFAPLRGSAQTFRFDDGSLWRAAA